MVLQRRLWWVVCGVGACLLAGCVGREAAWTVHAGQVAEDGPAPRGVVRGPVAASKPPRVPVRRAAEPFVVPERLKPQVDFWRDIFTRYSVRQVVIHDVARLGRIYRVLDFRPLEKAGMSRARIEQRAAKMVKREKRHIRSLLRRLYTAGGRARTAEERRIARLFGPSPDVKEFRRAAATDRIRAQTGIRERFARGIVVAHRYFPEMESIFRQEGVPLEVTRLALVESTFNVKAYSRRGAAGVWQFMRSTGRRFMRVDSVVDERRDPIIASRAAAKFLRENYDRLGSWPLAITAYNHGPAGIARAVKQLGTHDIVEIIERYRSRRFKFASRNFYAEFLAALDVERHRERYFGPLRMEQPVRTATVRTGHFVNLDTLAHCSGVKPEKLAELNPSLSRAVYDGKRRVPRGYALRIPVGREKTFGRRYAALPRAKKFSRQKPLYLVHRVRRGQTLGAIARRYGSSVERIRRYNRLRSRNFIRAGMLLRIPLG